MTSVNSYVTLDHDADIGIEAHGNDLKEAFIHAAEGMFSIIASSKKIKAEESHLIHLEEETTEDLLIAWLNKLLYLYDTKKILFAHFKITTLTHNTLRAKASGEKLNPKKHRIQTYIKAATHHQTTIQHNGDYVVRVIFDV